MRRLRRVRAGNERSIRNRSIDVLNELGHEWTHIGHQVSTATGSRWIDVHDCLATIQLVEHAARCCHSLFRSGRPNEGSHGLNPQEQNLHRCHAHYSDSSPCGRVTMLGRTTAVNRNAWTSDRTVPGWLLAPLIFHNPRFACPRAHPVDVASHPHRWRLQRLQATATVSLPRATSDRAAGRCSNRTRAAG